MKPLRLPRIGARQILRRGGLFLAALVMGATVGAFAQDVGRSPFLESIQYVFFDGIGWVVDSLRSVAVLPMLALFDVFAVSSKAASAWWWFASSVGMSVYVLTRWDHGSIEGWATLAQCHLVLGSAVWFWRKTRRAHELMEAEAMRRLSTQGPEQEAMGAEQHAAPIPGPEGKKS